MGAEQSQLEKFEAAAFSQNYVSFFVNGKEHNVNVGGLGPDLGPQYLLIDYLRDKIGNTGTKYTCRQGGCGACTVTIKSAHPVTGQSYVRSANSCLLPLYACDGLEITTVENLGNRRVGYSALQERLTQFGGTQCGFCTPGFVMNMHSIMKSNPRFTTSDVENSLDGNICRCTGYRPIMDAFKSFAINAPEDLKWKCNDIEDTFKCPNKKTLQNEQDPSLEKPEIIHVHRNLMLKSATGEVWFKVTTLNSLYDLLQRFTTSRVRYRLVAGNTGTGVYNNDGPYDGYIDINNVPELQFTSIDQESLSMGGGVTISAAVDLFDKAAQTGSFVYAQEASNLMRRTGGLAVRNRATIAGNLMMKHAHREFVSSLFVFFESIGATLTIGSSPTLSRQYSILDFLELDMTGKVILAVHLPALSELFFYKFYSLGRRYLNSVSYVNCGILLTVEKSSLAILKRPRICFGGINSQFVHASATEEFLQGKTLNVATLQQALLILGDEVSPDQNPLGGSPEFRRGLAQSFLYRCLLSVRGSTVDPRLRSGAEEIPRVIKKASQIYETDKTKWPLNQPISKLESLPQTSGEAEYINDIKAELDELFGVFVVATEGNAVIKSIDASQALRTPGVEAFITAKDIPGNNNFSVFYNEQEEIFADKRVRYAGQPVGLLLARDKYIAFGNVSKVVVHYENIQKPTLDIADVIPKEDTAAYAERKEPNLAFPCRGINAQTARNMVLCGMSSGRAQIDEDDEGDMKLSSYQVKGEYRTHSQYHMHMETQVCLCVPNENGMDVYSSTQHMNNIQVAIAGAINVPNNSITVHVRRLGGGFGAKISKAAHTAAACGVAAHVTHKPVRLALDLGTNMQTIGKRLPYLVKYDVKFDETGKIRKLDSELWCDPGYVANEPTSLYGMICMQSCYRGYGWNLKPSVALTDTPGNTYCRSPGSAQGVAAIENIMEHIAHTVKKDPLEVRQVNFIRKGDPFIGVPGARLPLDNLLPGMIAELKINADYESRRKFVDVFNRG